MKKTTGILFFILCLGALSGYAQERVMIHGEISVPEGFDLEGVTIYNKTSGRGTVSGEKGEFRLLMKVSDSLFFSAIQFKKLVVVVDRAAIDSGFLQLEIVEGVNELPEIVLKPHELSGNLAGDVKNAKSENRKFPTASQIHDNSWNFERDSQSAPENAAMGNPGGGANLLGLVGALANLVLPKKSSGRRSEKPRERTVKEKILLERQVRTTFDDTYFDETFDIPAHEISRFLSFCDEAGFDPDLLKQEQEFFLIQFLMEQSEKYRGLRDSKK